MSDGADEPATNHGESNTATTDGEGDRATRDDAGDPAEVGRWEPIEHRFGHLPVHVALLHTGKVLGFGGSANDETRLDDPYRAEVWDPQTGEVTVVDQDLAGDLFCVGHAFLPDGRLLAAGGTHAYDGTFEPFGLMTLPPFRGLDQAYLFDPETERWTRVEDLDRGRWYPTLVTLGDGRVLAAAGLTKRFPWVALREIEIYEPETGWERLDGAGRWLPLYPRLHLLPSGEVFYAGSYNTHYTFPFSLSGFPTGILDLVTRRWRDLGLPNEEEREEGASVLLPLEPEDDYRPRVLLAGGGTPTGEEAIRNAELIDLGEPDPEWRSLDPMNHARYYTYAVVLPTGDVLVVGGRSGHKGHLDRSFEGYDPDEGAVPHVEGAVHEAEVFHPENALDPDAPTWTTLAPMTVDRLYHSNAILLPDGRVMSAGSNPKRRVDELRIETFEPPYLFRGDRPTVDAAPEAVEHGETFGIGTVDAPDVETVALLRQSSTTHCLDTDQRYVGLRIVDREADELVVEMPGNPNVAPPGYYMLFLVSEEGVPSEAPFVRVAAEE